MLFLVCLTAAGIDCSIVSATLCWWAYRVFCWMSPDDRPGHPSGLRIVWLGLLDAGFAAMSLLPLWLAASHLAEMIGPTPRFAELLVLPFALFGRALTGWIIKLLATTGVLPARLRHAAWLGGLWQLGELAVVLLLHGLYRAFWPAFG